MDDERCPLGQHGAVCANIENLKEQVTRNCAATKGKVPWIMFVPVLTILVLIVGSLAGMHLSTQRAVNEIDKSVAIISNEIKHLNEYIQQITLKEEWKSDPVNTWDPYFKMLFPYMYDPNNVRFSHFTFNEP